MRFTVPFLVGAALCLASCGGGPNDSGENIVELEATAENAEDMVVENASDMTPVNAADTVLCEEVGERIASTDCDDVKAMKAKVREGAAALNVPDPMMRGRPYSVSLVIDLRELAKVEEIDAASNAVAAENAAEDVDAVEPIATNDVAMVPADEADDGTARERSLPRPRAEPPTPLARARSEEGKDVPFVASVGRRMRATLTGQGFDIRPINPKEGVLTIPEGGSGSWEWEVVPKQEGQRRLTVHTEAVARIGSRDVLIGNAESFKDVSVAVAAGDRAKATLQAIPEWLKLLTAVLVALAALLGAWFGLRKVWRKGDA